MSDRLQEQEYARYFPISAKEQAWGHYVTAAGYQPILPDMPYPPEGHPATHTFSWDRGRILDQFGIVYLVRGKGEFDSKQSSHYELNAGDLFFIFPHVWHRYRPIRDVGWEVHWIHFQGGDACRLQEQGFLSPENPVLTVGFSESIAGPFTQMLDWMRTEPTGFPQMMAATTMQIVATAIGLAGSQKIDSRLHTQICRAKLLLEKELGELPLMDHIAEELEMSRAHFFRVFKEHTGLTPYQYHLELKYNRARQMLQNSSTSVKRIALALGFKSVYHFSRFFKNKSGMAPTTWRKQWEVL